MAEALDLFSPAARAWFSGAFAAPTDVQERGWRAVRQVLTSVRWVIVDAIHSVAATKRGAHLAVSLERLCAITRSEPQRIGLSATQRPLEEVGRFLVGAGREVEIVDAGRRKTLDLRVEVPVDDMADLDRGAPAEPTLPPARRGQGGGSAGEG